MSIPYDFPSELHITSLLPLLARLEDAIARFDERLSTLPFGAGIAERLLFDEACSCAALQGMSVFREDLVLIDGNAYDGPPSIELSTTLHVLRIWRKALSGDAVRLLASQRPGETVDSEPANAEPAAFWHGCQGTVLEQWRTIMRRTTTLPPVLAAAIAADAWIALQSGASASWRASLLAALVLKARGKTRSFLLPLDRGRRLANVWRSARQSFEARIMGMLEGMEAGVAADRKETQRIALAEQMLALKLRRRRRSSRLPKLVDLLLRRPMISVPMAAKALRVSSQAVEQMLKQLGSTPRLLTERKRYRVWGI